jgi:hypothetical protein
LAKTNVWNEKLPPVRYWFASRSVSITNVAGHAASVQNHEPLERGGNVAMRMTVSPETKSLRETNGRMDLLHTAQHCEEGQYPQSGWYRISDMYCITSTYAVCVKDVLLMTHSGGL